MWIIVCVILYGCYYEASVWFSALDKDRGSDWCHVMLDRLSEIDTVPIFAKDGMTLYKTTAYWGGKRIRLVFCIGEENCTSIPAEIENCILQHRNEIGPNRVSVEVRYASEGRDMNPWETCIIFEKTYFWWRALY